MRKWATLLLFGCATVRMGKYQLVKDIWEQDQEEIRNRASFEMKCADLQLTVLAVRYGGGGPNHARQVGVEGCGQHVVYANSEKGWVPTPQLETVK